MTAYTNKQKDEMMNKVMTIAEEITGQTWRRDGGDITNDECTMAINIYDYMDDYCENEELDNLVACVRRLIEEQEEVIE